MSKKGIFITGTDTGVGKSIVAAVLVRLLHERGANVGVMKPVTCGCTNVNGRLVSEDAELLTWAARCDPADPDITPYILKAPIVPSVAASREGVRIDLGRISEAYRRLADRHDFVIVEGAGGFMVPLCGGILIADLVKRLELPLLVVARPNLGTINHTLLTCFAARQMDLELRGIVINDYPEAPGMAEEYAPHLLDSLSGAPLLGLFHHHEAETDRNIVELLTERYQQEPATRIMLREIGIG